MRTYPILSDSDEKQSAFEIDNAYVGRSAISKILKQLDGVKNVQSRKGLTASPDVHIEFEYFGRPYIVWEPYGDSSRYWIGPKEGLQYRAPIEDIEKAFIIYQPPLYRRVIGDVLTLRFITRLFQRGQ